jgi:hypothetical protein
MHPKNNPLLKSRQQQPHHFRKLAGTDLAGFEKAFSKFKSFWRLTAKSLLIQYKIRHCLTIL